MKKLKKTARVLDVTAKAVRGISVAVSVLMLVALILVVIFGGYPGPGGTQAEAAASRVDSTLSLGFIRLKVAGSIPIPERTFCCQRW